MKKFNIFSIVVSIIVLLTFAGCQTNTPSVEVNNSYFSMATYEQNTYQNVGFNGAGITYQYALTCTSSCSVSLYEYSAVVKLYSSSNELLETQKISKTENVNAHTYFSFEVIVSKQVQSDTAYIDAVFSGKTHDQSISATQEHLVTFVYNNGTSASSVFVEDGKTVAPPNEPTKPYHTFCGWYTERSFVNKYDFFNPITNDLTLYAKYEPIPVQTHTVYFIYNNGTPMSAVSVENGKTVATPSEPTKQNYLFIGWYTESSFVNKYDFSKPITNDLTLYAKYEIDALTLTNKISTDYIKGVVKIYNKCYNSFLGYETAASTSLGSGFCFHIQDGCYYVLTNCHVAKKDTSYDKQQYTIEDYQGNTYKGYLYSNSNKSGAAIDASYDLACLYFKPSSTNVKKLSIASDNPAVDNDVISLGAPEDQSNSITYGRVNGYKKITLNTAKSSSNVTFEVIVHTAYTNGGSSGGPLMDPNLCVVGVHYAGNHSAGIGYAIPIKKVKEFLKTYVYN